MGKYSFQLFLIALVVFGLIRAFRAGGPRRAAEEIRGLLYVLVVGVVIITFIIRVYDIPEETADVISTLASGDRIFLRKTDYWLRQPNRGELVMFQLHSD